MHWGTVETNVAAPGPKSRAIGHSLRVVPVEDPLTSSEVLGIDDLAVDPHVPDQYLVRHSFELNLYRLSLIQSVLQPCQLHSPERGGMVKMSR